MLQHLVVQTQIRLTRILIRAVSVHIPMVLVPLQVVVRIIALHQTLGNQVSALEGLLEEARLRPNRLEKEEARWNTLHIVSNG